MEVALILYMCSALQKTCLDPYIWPDRFYDKYGCMVEGYRESEKKIKEIGREDVNQHDIAPIFSFFIINLIRYF